MNPNGRFRLIVSLTLGGFALLSTFLILVAHQPSPWVAWRPATCLQDNCFCEAIRPFAVTQPANSISSLAFLLTAGLVLAFPSGQIPRYANSRSQRVDAYLFSSALMLIGLGSAFYHASLTFVGQTFDVLGMYLLATVIVLWNLSRSWRISPSMAVVGYVAGNAVLFSLLVAVPALRRYAFAGLIGTILFLEYRAGSPVPGQRGRVYLWAAIATLGVGFTFWVADITKTVCLPSSWLQGHSVWHFLGAISAGLVYVHYHHAPRRHL